MLSTIQPYLSLLFLILCSYFHLLFLTLLATRYILLFTMFDSISLQPARNVTELTKTLYSSRRKKKCRVNYNQNKCSKHIVQSTSFASLFIHILIYGVRKTSPRKKAPPLVRSQGQGQGWVRDRVRFRVWGAFFQWGYFVIKKLPNNIPYRNL